MSKVLIALIALVCLTGAGYDPVAGWHDNSTGDKRLAEIRSRLEAATPCPWKSDGRVEGWWNNEQPGVDVRSAANLRVSGEQWYVDARGQKSNAMPSYSVGGPVAQISSAYWSGSKNPIADAEFIAHSCEDIKYLLDQIQHGGHQ